MTDTQLSMEDAIARGVAGGDTAAANSGAEWIGYATGFVEQWLRTHRTLFCDDLWAAGLIEPESLRAFGAVLAAAARNGWMEKIPVGVGGAVMARPSVRSHGQLKPVWRSLVFEGGSSN